MAELKMKVQVDTKELDRLAIGGRIYDMFDTEKCMNRVHFDRERKAIQIKEKDVVDMVGLINPILIRRGFTVEVTKD